MSQRGPGSNVLVGGFKPEDIQKAYLEKKRREEAGQNARDRTDGAKQDAGTTPAGAATSAGKRRGKRKGSPRPTVGVRVSDISHWQSSVKTIYYGHFDVDDIRRAPQGYEFINLQTPIGRFSSLTLAKDLFTYPDGQVAQMDLRAWNNTVLSRLLDPINPPGFRMMPLWLRYALMNVCYQKKDASTSFNDVINEIREQVWNPDCHSRPPYNATMVQYLASPYQTIIHGFGWPTDHPLFQVNSQAELPDNLRSSITNASTRVIPALEALLYENDPGRARRTFLWASGQKSEVLMRTIHTPGTARDMTYILGAGRGINTKSVAVFDCVDIPHARPARGIKIDLDDFKPYKGGAP